MPPLPVRAAHGTGPGGSLVERRLPAGRVRLGDLLAVLRRGWLLLLTCAAAFAALGFALLLRQRAVYEGVTTLRIEANPVQGEILGIDGLPGADNVETEMEALRSRALAAEVADSLGLALTLVEPAGIARDSLLHGVRASGAAREALYRFRKGDDGRFRLHEVEGGDESPPPPPIAPVAPGERVALPGVSFTLTPAAAGVREFSVRTVTQDDAVEGLRGALRVRRPNATASIVQVQYQSPDRVLARDVPNTLSERFIAQRRDVRRSDTRIGAGFLREQIARTTTELRAREDTLRRFREAEQVVNLQEQARSAIGQRAQLQAQRDALEAERAALADVLGARVRGGTGSYRSLVAFPTLLRNQAISGLLTALNTVEDRRTELLTRRSPVDPEVQVLTRRVEDLEQQIRAIAATYLQGLTAQVRAIDETLGQASSELGRVPAREIALARQERDVNALRELVTQLETRLREAQIAEVVEDANVRIIDAAVLPARAEAGGRALVLGPLLVLGLLLGAALALLREYRDRSVRSAEDAQAATHVPVLGVIPLLTALPRDRRLRALPAAVRRRLPAPAGTGVRSAARDESPVPEAVTVAAPVRSGPLPNGRRGDATADAYDRLYANLQLLLADHPVRTLLVASALSGEGRTTTAVNLAVTLARGGMRVLLVDADLRGGVVHRTLGAAAPTPGVADVLTGAVAIEDAVRETRVGDDGAMLRWIGAGERPPNPALLLGSGRMEALLRRAREAHDLVVVDSSPLSVGADTMMLAAHVEGIALVARVGVTPFDALAFAAQQLQRAKLPLVGGVLNALDPARDGWRDATTRWHVAGAAAEATRDDGQR